MPGLLFLALAGASTSVMAVHATAAEASMLQSRTVNFNIPAQSANSGLREFSRQAGVQVLFSSDALAGLRTNALTGRHTHSRALAIMLAGTPLEVVRNGNRQYSVRRPRNSRSTAAVRGANNAGSNRQARRGARIAANGSAQSNPPPNRSTQNQNDQTAEALPGAATEDDERRENPIIVVTGTNIRGVAPVGSPVETFTREEILETGRGTVQDFIQTLPQNFNGGFSESTFALRGDSGSLDFGTGVNLRGLGNISSLVLLNGHRLAPPGFGNAVDISMIPLTVVERVEVLSDGASAIYGSDAVAGVVNFRMREDYDGAETRLRYGTATSGDLDEIQFGQVFGRVWNTGNALISYEYYQRDRLDTNDREFSEDANDPQDLFPEQERHSVFFAARQELSESAELFADAIYSRRETDNLQAFVNPIRRLSETDQLGLSIGGTFELGSEWQSEIIGAYGLNEVSTRSGPFGSASFTNDNETTNDIWSLDGRVDGPLVGLPGGEIRLALGGHYREESRSGATGAGRQFSGARDVYALFAEIYVPIVTDANRMPGIERLELTVAGRYEEYSDFGSSTDPKVGLLWSPIDGLDLRGTFGTSFRAPTFNETDPSTSQGLLVNISDPNSPSGQTVAILALGNNSDLGPERSTNWTFGLDFAPPSIPGLSASLTYFDIDSTDRIGSVFAFSTALSDPRFASLVDRPPDPDLVTFLASQPFSLNFAPGFEFADAEALVDFRRRNLSSLRTRGLDFDLTYTIDSSVGAFRFDVGGTYLFEQSTQILPPDEPFDVVDTVFNPADFRLRGSLSWSHQGFSTNLAINYVDSYRNDRVEPAIPIDSWTTFDLYVAYNTGDRSAAWIRNTTFAFTTLNLFDEDPPFTDANFGSINFDSTNANARGRTIAFQITRQW